MISLYYKIWADAIAYEKKHHSQFRNWKFYTMVGVSISQGLNLFGLLLLIRPLGITYNLFLNIDFFPGEFLDKALSSVLTLFTLPVLVNYLLIFHRKRYEKISQEYKTEGTVGKWYAGYFIISALAVFLPIIFFKWIW